MLAVCRGLVNRCDAGGGRWLCYISMRTQRLGGSGVNKVVNLDNLRLACRSCGLKEMCLPHGVPSEDLNRIDQIVQRRRPLRRGDLVFRAGEPAHSVYALRAGALKTYTLTPGGEEQVIGLHLPGDLIGLDGIAEGVHGCSAVALDTASVCAIPLEQVEQLSREVPALQHQLLRILSREIRQDQELMVWLGKRSAEERLALLLTTISERLTQRGFSGSDFSLSMSRGDIANYLGLAVETVSRLFARLQERGIIEVDRKQVHIADLPALRRVARCEGGCSHSAMPR